MTLMEPAMLCLESWRAHTQANPARPSLLDSVYDDAEAFEFVRDIFEYVALSHDAFTAALRLNELARHTPETMPKRLKLALRVGGIASMGLPWGVIPAVKQRFRAHVQDLLITTEDLPGPEQLGGTTDIEPLGVPVTGENGVQKELERLTELVHTDGLARITVHVERLIPHLRDWSLDSAGPVFAQLTSAFFREAATANTTVTLRASTYAHALTLPTLASHVLDTLSSAAPLGTLTLGVELLAELPETVASIDELAALTPAEHRLEVRLTSRSIANREAIRSAEQGLAVPSLQHRPERDAAWASLLTRLMDPRFAPHLGVSVATEDPLLLALAQVIWQRYEHDTPLRAVLAAGRAPALAEAARATGIEVCTLTPVVPAQEFPGAFPAVLDTLTQVVTPGDWFEQARDLGEAPSLTSFRDRLTAALSETPHDSHRQQYRAREWEPETPHLYRPPTEAHQFDTGGLTTQVLRLTLDEAQEQMRTEFSAPLHIPVVSDTGFACEPDTDAAQPRNRDWMRGILANALDSTAGLAGARAAQRGPWALDTVLERARQSGFTWSTYTHQQRATLVRRVALAFSVARDRLVSVIAAERGLPVHEIDHEVGYAIDAARYLATRAEHLRAVRGAEFIPRPLTLLIADRDTSPGALAESLIAVIAAGSGTLLTADASLGRTASVLVEECVAAGIPEGTITLVTPHHSLEDTVERVLTSGVCDAVAGYASDQLARRVRTHAPALPRELRTPRTGAALVAPSADPYAAAHEVAHSLLWGGGGHHQTLHAAIIIAGGTTGDVFTTALAHELSAVRAGGSGATDALELTLAPLPAPPTDAQLRALTELAHGESWVLQPTQLDDRTWSPGVRAGVRPEARFWQDSRGVPVIGIAHARSVHDALRVHEQIADGGVTAVFSYDADDIVPVLERAHSAHLVVNTRTTGARVERQPAGAWGELTLAGGPNRLLPHGTWRLRPGTPSDTLHLRGLDPLVRRLIETVQPLLGYQEFDQVRRAALADALAWKTHFGTVQDRFNLPTERNVLHYRKVPVHVRCAEDAALVDVVRVLIAAALVGATLTISTGIELPGALRAECAYLGVPLTHETDEAWLERASRQGEWVSGDTPATRIRLIGGDPIRTIEWLSSHPHIAVLPAEVTMAGSVELITFMREQHLTVNLARHGLVHPISGVEEWLGISGIA